MSTVKRMFILIMMLLLLLLPGLAREASGAAQLSGTLTAADTPWCAELTGGQAPLLHLEIIS